MELNLHRLTLANLLVFLWKLILYKGRTKCAFQFFTCLFWIWRRRGGLDIDI
ncbi:hypothetical protein Syncc8109_0599 [Synechococcus sp. WH 8109]|nr:hypothetical protein Syncc8109_0599 [Synechococcus sp. WH 8109]